MLELKTKLKKFNIECGKNFEWGIFVQYGLWGQKGTPESKMEVSLIKNELFNKLLGHTSSLCVRLKYEFTLFNSKVQRNIKPGSQFYAEWNFLGITRYITQLFLNIISCRFFSASSQPPAGLRETKNRSFSIKYKTKNGMVWVLFSYSSALLKISLWISEHGIEICMHVQFIFLRFRGIHDTIEKKIGTKKSEAEIWASVLPFLFLEWKRYACKKEEPFLRQTAANTMKREEGGYSKSLKVLLI